MHHISKFISWYLSPRARLGRPVFNWVVFIAFIPVVALQFMHFSESVQQTAAAVYNIQDQFQAMQYAAESQDLGGALLQADELAQRLSQAGSTTGLFPSQQPKNLNSLPLEDILQLLILALIAPLVLMRLRDIGIRTPWKIWSLMAMIYAASFGELLALAGFPLGGGLGFLCGVLSLFSLGYACTKSSAPYTPPSQRNLQNPPNSLQ